MKITSKFAGKCRNCGAEIATGQEIEWSRENGATCLGGCIAKTVQLVGEGVYVCDGKFYRVQKGKRYAEALTMIGGNRLNDANSVVKFDYVFEKGAIWKLRDDMAITEEQAKGFGIQYGICAICGLPLKDAKSVARGVGPQCAKRMGWK